EGKPKLVLISSPEGFPEAELLRLAASLERASEHPLAAAIVAGAQERGIELAKTESFASITGKGVTGKVNGRLVALGNRVLLEELKIDTGTLADEAQQRRASGQTVMFIVVDGRPAGLLAVADPIKQSTPDAIKELHANGIKIVMLTGDSRATAQAVAGQ